MDITMMMCLVVTPLVARYQVSEDPYFPYLTGR